MKEFRNKLFLLLSFSIFMLTPIFSYSQEEEIEDGIPDDILELMKTLPNFRPDVGTFELSTISGWFKEDGKEYGLINAEIVKFEWEDYSGTQKSTLYRNFDEEKKWTDYKEWLTNMDKRKKLVSVRISPNNEAILYLSNELNFPAKFSYKLEFDENIITTGNNNKCNGTETISSDFIEEAGIYKLHYNIDGCEGLTSFIIK